jgi:hypothetical protein
LRIRHYQQSAPSKKNHTKKPTVGFLVFGAYGRISIVKVEKHTDHVVGEAVAMSRLDGVSAHRVARLASIPGSKRKSLIPKAGFMQVVDFQDRPYVTR